MKQQHRSPVGMKAKNQLGTLVTVDRFYPWLDVGFRLGQPAAVRAGPGIGGGACRAGQPPRRPAGPGMVKEGRAESARRGVLPAPHRHVHRHGYHRWQPAGLPSA